ncbi:MAG: hypothetical protein WCK35_00730 [Chloroflexota bacterium]
MQTLDVLLRSAIQIAVMGVWGLFGLALIAGLTGRTIRWVWMKTHPVTTIVRAQGPDVVDAEWVRDF